MTSINSAFTKYPSMEKFWIKKIPQLVRDLILRVTSTSLVL